MSAARYWRAIGLQSVGGGALELSALHLYLSGARVDATATLTSTIAPTAGTLANLQDDDTTTVCRFADVTAPGFALVWDFGAGNTQDVRAVRLGSGSLRSEFLERVTLQHSSDGVAWATLASIPAFAWPGAGAMQPVPASGDPDFDKVSLLLPMDGANGSTVFTDSSPTPKTVTATGNAQISTAQSKFGGASAYFNGVSAALKTSHQLGFNFGTGDFTVEAWVWQAGPVSQWREIFMLNVRDGLNVMLYDGKLVVGRELIANDYTASAAITQNTWHHIAVTRSAGIARGFVDGVQVFSGPSVFDFSQVGEVSVGGKSDGGNALSGYLDDLRITKGVARYTENFTPPTEPFPDFSGGAAPAAPRGIPQAPAIVLSGGASAPAGPVLAPAAITRDMQDSGRYRISNFVERQGTPSIPLRRRVQLWNQRDARMVRETWSNAITGAYTFDNIRGGDGTRYCAVAYDHTGHFQGVIADNLEPEAM